jgi:hypothetical protein
MCAPPINAGYTVSVRGVARASPGEEIVADRARLHHDRELLRS